MKEGEINVTENDKVIRTLKRGDYFGEKSILLDAKRSKDCKAKTNCVVCSVSAETLKNLIGPKYRESLYLNFMKMAMTESRIFNKFKLKLLDSALSLFKIRNLSLNEIAIKAGSVMSATLIVIIQGNLVEVSCLIINILLKINNI